MTPSAPADPNARYSRCRGGDFSTFKLPRYFRASYALNVQETIQGTGIGFRTFRPLVRVLPPRFELGSSPAETFKNVAGGCHHSTEPYDARSSSRFAADPSAIHYIGFRTFRAAHKQVSWA